jgi:hypothetical protein
MNAKLNLWFAASLLLTSAAFSQSSFEIYNHRVTSGIDAPVFDSIGRPLEGTNYAAELWGGATSDSLAPALSYYAKTRVIIPFLTGPDAGYFRHLGDPVNGDPSIFAVPPKDWAWLQIRAWDARLGATYDEAVAAGLGGYGESSVFYAQGGDPTSLIPGRPGSLIGLQSFSLRAIPEPATLGLLAVAGISVMFLRWWRSPRERNKR